MTPKTCNSVKKIMTAQAVLAGYLLAADGKVCGFL